MLALVMKNRRFNFILGSILPSSAQKPQNLISCQRDSAYRFSPKLSRPLLENLQSVSVSALKVLLTLAKISIILSKENLPDFAETPPASSSYLQ